MIQYPAESTPGVPSIIEHLGRHPMRPKQEIGQAMAALGFRVPRIFDTYEDAVSCGDRFFAWSEHPGELYYSGLGMSYDSEGMHSEEIEAVQKGIDDPDRTYWTLRRIARMAGAHYGHVATWHRLLTGKSSHGFDTEVLRDASLSYWQAAKGANYFLVPDNGREDRFYIGRVDEQEFYVVDEGEINRPASYTGENDPPVQELMGYYEQVVGAAPFDASVAHIVECAYDGETEPVFLQALPTRPRQIAEFAVTNSQESILYVRGVTPAEGIEFDILAYDPSHEDYHGGPFSYGLHEGEGQYEYAVSHATALFPAKGGDRWTSDTFLRQLGMAAPAHSGRSMIFKPGVTVGLTETAYNQLHGDDPFTKRRAWVRSDGVGATIRYWDSSEQKIKQL